MNKERVNEWIPKAYEAIREVKIEENGMVDKSFRGQISTFGAAISMGSLSAAIAFFSDAGSASVDRTKLMKALNRMLNPKGSSDFYFYVKDRIDKGQEEQCREDVIHAAIALKLAMNLYPLKDKEA